MFGKRKQEQPEMALGQLEKLVRERPYHVVSLHCTDRGITPGKFYEEVQETYKACMIRDNLARMQLVRETTGIIPAEGVVSRIQEKYCEYASIGQSDKIRALQEASGVPLNDTAQATYLRHNIEKQLLPREEVEQLRLAGSQSAGKA